MHNHSTTGPVLDGMRKVNRKGVNKKLECKERKILRKILHPDKENCEYRIMNCRRMWKTNEHSSNRRTSLYGHLIRIDPERLTYRIVGYFLRLKTKGRSVSPKWKYICKKWVSHLKTSRNPALLRRNLVHTRFSRRAQAKKKQEWTEEWKEANRKLMQWYESLSRKKKTVHITWFVTWRIEKTTPALYLEIICIAPNWDTLILTFIPTTSRGVLLNCMFDSYSHSSLPIWKFVNT